MKENRNSYKNVSLFICLVLLLSYVQAGVSFAVPASPDTVDLMQPDGTVFSASVKGDEWNNRVETNDGYSIRKHTDGYWKYISRYDNDIPVLSGADAHKGPPANIKKNLRRRLRYRRGPKERLPDDNAGMVSSDTTMTGTSLPAGGASAYGTFNGKILFILAEFTDRAGTYSESSFASFITDNISDYFNKTSYGSVTLIPADETFGTADNGVIGWVNVGYAHPDTAGSTDDRNRQLARDAIIAADPYIDYSLYDANSDNYVDADELAVVVIAAGYETSYDGGTYRPTVWGHKWSLGWGVVTSPVVDGVSVGDYHVDMGGYAQFGEIHRSSSSNSHQATMGIMVHELGHLIFGLPDLYDIDGSSEGIGAFGIMGSGSWGKTSSDIYPGETPVLASAWTKYDRGWVAGSTSYGSTTIAGAGSTSATGLNTVFKVTTELPNEYFFVENRQPVGYDRGLERWLGTSFGGLAIWHIDESKINNTEECYPPSDCTSTHFKIALVQADNYWQLEKGTNRGNSTDLWYPGNADTFDSSTAPDSDLYNGSLSSVSISSISSSGDPMNATLAAPSMYTVFSEDFESGILGPYWSTNTTKDGRIRVIPDYRPHWGNYHLTMDDSVDGGASSLNELILTVDLSGQTGVMLSFFHIEFGDEDNVMPVSFSGSSNSDGVAISADGTTWYKVQGLTAIDGIYYYYRSFVVDLDAAVASAGISYNSSFMIKFQQFDNYSIDSDGFAFDDILITAVDPSPLSPPTPGAVMPYNTQYNNFVDSPFDLATDFTDNESAVTSCEYCLSTDGTCDTEWMPADLSGTGPSWNCSRTGLTGTDGQTLTLNMRASSEGGTGAGTVVVRTADSSPPETIDDSAVFWTSASPVTVLLSADDATGSGIALTEYCVDTLNNCTPDTAGSSVNVSCAIGSNCLQYVRYLSEDNVGNRETVKTSSQIRQDLRAPIDGTLTAIPGDSQVDLQWSGFSDTGSGLDITDTYKLVYSTSGFPGENCADGTEITDVTTQTDYNLPGLTNGSTYYYRLCAYDAVNNISTGATISLTLPYQLTTSVSPALSGNVTPDCSAGCQYDSGNIVILTAAENSGYFFDHWTNCDSTFNNICTETMDTDKDITANFQLCYQPVRINSEPPVYYSNLQSAYDQAFDGDIIQSRDVIFSDDLNAVRSISVILEGGYNCNYSEVTGWTIFNGTMTVSDGMVTIGDYFFEN